MDELLKCFDHVGIQLEYIMALQLLLLFWSVFHTVVVAAVAVVIVVVVHGNGLLQLVLFLQFMIVDGKFVGLLQRWWFLFILLRDADNA